MILTYRYRVKDSTVGKYLDRHSRAVNFVWNYCCEIQREAQARHIAGRFARWPTSFDLINLCVGVAADLGLHSDTVAAVCRQFITSRDDMKRCPRFRTSRGPKRSLGWLPFVARAIQVNGACVTYRKRKFRFWKSRDIGGEIKSGCFAQDARNRWYVAFQCKIVDKLQTGSAIIGIDLGLKALATCSNGTVIPALQHFRKYQAMLAISQRAGNKRRVSAIHAKITNSRRHHLHEQSTKIARENELIVIGNVNAAKLAKTRMAKSVLDAGWSMFRNQLRYKASRHGARYVEADERSTSQTCSCCGNIPASSPKGMGALGIRHWVCSDCGESHDRDVNAARNILRVGVERHPPAVEIPFLQGEGRRYSGLPATKNPLTPVSPHPQ